MRSLVKKISNWPALKTNRKLIIFMSDDWGSMRIKSLQDQQELIKKGLIINNRFDQFDTLESNKDMEGLFEILLKHKDGKGNHPIITAVTNVGNPDFKRIQENNFQQYFHESIDESYKRNVGSDKVLELAKHGIQEKIYVPQFHGREHLQVNWWMQELQNENSFSRLAFENHFFFFPSEYIQTNRRNRDFAAAFDVWNQNDIDTQKEILKSGLSIFENLFRYRAKVFTPPALFYNPAIEKTLVKEEVD